MVFKLGMDVICFFRIHGGITAHIQTSSGRNRGLIKRGVCRSPIGIASESAFFPTSSSTHAVRTAMKSNVALHPDYGPDICLAQYADSAS